MKTLLLTAISIYAALCAFMYVTQRSLMYFPENARTIPEQAGLPEAKEEKLVTSDGETIIVWHIPPRDAMKRVVVYFHGNGGALRFRVHRFARLAAQGMGVIAVSYRGYGGSTGSPTEDGLIADGIAAYEFAAKLYTPARVAVWGESLGSGVAIAVAAEAPVAKLVLEAPFSSAADVAVGVYFYLPVRLLMKDQFRSDRRIGNVKAPILVLHGERDSVVPFALGQKLFDLIPGDKKFVRFKDGGHEDLDRYGGFEAAAEFLNR